MYTFWWIEHIHVYSHDKITTVKAVSYIFFVFQIFLLHFPLILSWVMIILLALSIIHWSLKLVLCNWECIQNWSHLCQFPASQKLFWWVLEMWGLLVMLERVIRKTPVTRGIIATSPVGSCAWCSGMWHHLYHPSGWNAGTQQSDNVFALVLLLDVCSFVFQKLSGKQLS